MRHPLSIYVRSTSRSVERLTGKFSRRIKLYLPATQQSSISLSAQQTRPIIEKETLASAFSTLGLKLGDSVMVHSGISNLGKVAGGPKSVFDLIQDTIGPTGKVLLLGYQKISHRTSVYRLKSRNGPSSTIA